LDIPWETEKNKKIYEMSIIIVVPTFDTKIETHDAKLNSNHYKKLTYTGILKPLL